MTHEEDGRLKRFVMALFLGCVATGVRADNPEALPDAVAPTESEVRETAEFLPEPGLLVLSSLGILSLVLIRARVEG